jgi:seryl-tRNA synthetase
MFDLELLRDDRDAVAAALSKRPSSDETERALTGILELAGERRSLSGRLDEARRVPRS